METPHTNQLEPTVKALVEDRNRLLVERDAAMALAAARKDALEIAIKCAETAQAGRTGIK